MEQDSESKLKLSYIIIPLVLFLVAVSYGGYRAYKILSIVDKNDQTATATNAEAEVKGVTQEVDMEEAEASEVNYEFYAENEGDSAFDVLEANADIEYDESEFGIFVTSINGLAGDDNHYWALYVNDEYAVAGVDATILKEGDKVSFKYEEIQF